MELSEAIERVKADLEKHGAKVTIVDKSIFGFIMRAEFPDKTWVITDIEVQNDRATD